MKHALWVVLAIACSKSGDPAPPAHHEDRHEPAAAPVKAMVDVAIDGATTSWTREVFDRVPRRAGKASDGEGRDTWSLRELAHQAVGPSARVVAVVGVGRKTIDQAAWDDASRTPILHSTKRGTLKFRWEDGAGNWGETEVKDVTKLEIVR
jgi:hypothetical protein